MKLITEYVENNLETICEARKDGSKHYFIEGVFMQSNQKNRNGRIYEKKNLEKAVAVYLKAVLSLVYQVVVWEVLYRRMALNMWEMTLCYQL